MTPLLEELSYETRCSTCAHWDTVDAVIGQCRFNAPAIMSGYDYGQWPVTHEGDWCAQFQRRI